MYLPLLKQAVDLSSDSVKQGRFPSGAVLAYGDEIICSAIGSEYPSQHLHADTKIIDEAIGKLNKQLEGYEIYTTLSPCLMCLGKIYWSGIQRVYYVLSREDVDVRFSYEGNHDFDSIVKNLNRKIEFIQDKTYFDAALEIYKSWQHP